MNWNLKQKLPLLFLIGASSWWAYYYQSNSTLNDFGAANFEWLFLIDGLLVLPILCLICIEDRKEAAIKIVLYSCLIIFIGSIIIPDTSKIIWPFLESGRYLVIFGLVLIEAAALLTVVIAIHAALKRGMDPDTAVASPVKRIFGKGLLTDILSFEARAWTYALFANAIRFENFSVQKHFSYHKKDDAKSNSMGFIILILFEVPLVHLVLHFLWSPLAASVISGLTLLGLVFLFAENRAMERRPISIDDDRIIIRYGIFKPKVVLLKNIKSINEINEFIPRSKSVKRFNFSGHPNIVINLIEPDGYVEKIYLLLSTISDESRVEVLKRAGNKIENLRYCNADD